MSTENVQYGSSGDLDEIVFQNRNREYGAYDLRKVYKNYLTKSVLIGTTLFVLAIVVPFTYAKIKEANKVEEKQVSVNLEEIYDQPKEEQQEEKQEAAPPPPPKQEEVKQEIIKYVIPELSNKYGDFFNLFGEKVIGIGKVEDAEYSKYLES